MNTQMLDHLQRISVQYLQQVCLLITGLMHHMNINSSVIVLQTENNLMPR